MAAEYAIEVEEMTKNRNTGALSLKLKDSSDNLSADFWSGAKEAIIYVRISDGNNDVISDVIPMVGL